MIFNLNIFRKKKFSFFVKWTFVTASGKYVFKEENVLENWNLGRLVERALDNLNPEQNAEFIIDPGNDILILRNNFVLYDLYN